MVQSPRWRLHPKGIPGQPDLVFPDANVVVFIDGCFWHGCPKCGHVPKTNRSFWRKKLERRRQRDIQVTSDLREAGYIVIRLWEHELQNDLAGSVAKIRAAANQI